MLRAVCRLKDQAGGRGRLIVAHFNHRLRGEHADQDAQWVARLAEQLHLQHVVGESSQADALPVTEEAARNARYAFLLAAARRLGVRHVATAHTADDQVETVLHRVLRGTGIGGLAGIPQTRALADGVTLVRPLLETTRQQVEAYLDQLRQPWRTDSTNQQPRFARNRIRNQLLPQLREEWGTGVDAALLRLAQQADEARELVAQLAHEALEEAALCDPQAGQIMLDPQRLTRHAPLIIRESCKLAWRDAGWPEQEMGDRHWRRLQELLLSPGAAAIMLPSGVRARWQQGRVLLARP